jgi:hypothetical protein
MRSYGQAAQCVLAISCSSWGASTVGHQITADLGRIDPIVRSGAILSKKSKIERLRKSREGRLFVVSVAASLSRTGTRTLLCESMWSSHRRAWHAPAALQHFVRQPKRTFSTVSVISRPDGVTAECPLYPPITDIDDCRINVRFAPVAAVCADSPLHARGAFVTRRCIHAATIPQRTDLICMNENLCRAAKVPLICHRGGDEIGPLASGPRDLV